PHRALHLDCCLAPLPRGEALVAADHLSPEALSLLGSHLGDLVPLDRREAALHLAANLLWLDQTQAVSSSAARGTNQLLRSMGYEVHELDFTALTCMWGLCNRMSLCKAMRKAARKSARAGAVDVPVAWQRLVGCPLLWALLLPDRPSILPV